MKCLRHLKHFLKTNQKTKENVNFKATKSLCDDKGIPVDWVLRPISTEENEEIRSDAFITIVLNAKKGLTRRDFDIIKYKSALMTAAIVEPNLYSEELQNSYGTKKPDELLKRMIPEAGEFDALFEKINQISGMDSLDDLVKEAKNS